MKEENGKPVGASPAESTALPEQTAGYWQRVSRQYRRAARMLTLLLILFVVVFVSLSIDAFSYNGIFYFGRDVAALTALADDRSETVYYTYGEVESAKATYRGGVAIVFENGVETYGADGERLMHLDGSFSAPRIAVSRDYLIAYSFGDNAFCVCNTYSELFADTTEFPIMGAYVSDAGYFALITGSDETLSEVLLYDGNFHLVQRFGRASATVSAVISDNGRYIAILGAASDGAVLDLFMVGNAEPTLSERFDAFPYAVSFTSFNTLAVLTDSSIHTLNIDGKSFSSVDFEGASLAAYSVGDSTVAAVLEADRENGICRLIVTDKKGRILLDNGTLEGRISAISLTEQSVWILRDRTLECLSLDGTLRGSFALENGALSMDALSETDARVFYGARAEAFSLSK
ncbi:MAG: hypothetical protein E7663_01015 [Ruminococcaceae bacterium]|nr:hypothetical protein [Oscillospiraceae bacterium]